MNRHVLLILAACVIAGPGKALAETWCNATYTPDPPSCHSAALYCQDVDRVCNGAPACPPPPPEPCADDAQWSWTAIRQAFPRTSSINDGGTLCGVEFKPEDGVDWYSSPPYGTRYPKGDLGQATVDLRDDIEYIFGSGYDTVIATDEYPLVLRFDMCGGNWEGVVIPGVHVQWDIGVFELFLDTGQVNQNRSPMDYILLGADDGTGCINCNSMCTPPDRSWAAPWPFVCQTYETPAGGGVCPPAQTNIRTAISVGANALLDNNPCHCELTDPETKFNQKPTNYHLSFYDGLKWRIINPDHPGPPGENPVWWTDHPNPTNFDYFVLGEKTNNITMTVKTNTVDFYQRTRIKINDEWVWVQSSVTGISRQYLGAFNKLHGGASIGCEMDENGNCVGNRHCLHSGYDTCDGSPKAIWNARWLSFDNIALDGGLPEFAEGACCFAAGACSVMLPDECAAAGGSFGGPFTACDESACMGACCMETGTCTDTYHDECAGTFQGLGTNCATTLCDCPTPFADADADGDVDQKDFAAFQRCITGVGPTNVPAECRCFNHHTGLDDPDIDLDDFEAFKACASGAGVPADPGCGG